MAGLRMVEARSWLGRLNEGIILRERAILSHAGPCAAVSVSSLRGH